MLISQYSAATQVEDYCPAVPSRDILSGVYVSAQWLTSLLRYLAVRILSRLWTGTFTTRARVSATGLNCFRVEGINMI